MSKGTLRKNVESAMTVPSASIFIRLLCPRQMSPTGDEYRPFFFVSDLQDHIEDFPQFCLFYIAFGLEVIALILSAIADISPHDRERVKKVNVYFFLTDY